MGIFDGLGLFVREHEAEIEEDNLNVEEIFRFDVSLTADKVIEIGVTVKELALDGIPEFGEEYGRLAHTFAELIVEHVGMNTERFMGEVGDLPALDIELTDYEKAVLNEKESEDTGRPDSNSVMLYSFPVFIMEGDSKDTVNNQEYDGDRRIGVSFERSSKAELMAKVYGEQYTEEESLYEEKTVNDILDHGLLFAKAVETIRAE